MSLLARVLEHWQLKLLSLVFAVALWFFVASEEGEAVYTIPLTLAGVPRGIEVTALGVETVDVRVKGLRSVLARLQEGDLRAEVPLRQAKPGETVARIVAENVRAPRGVQVVRVTPSRVRVTLGASR